MPKSLRSALIVALLCPVVLSGCRAVVPDPDPATRPAGVAPKPLESRAVLPKGFPQEVPVIDGVVSRADATGDRELGPWHVIIESPSDLGQAAAWYRDVFEQRSWRILHDAESEAGVVLAFAKGAGAWCTVRIGPTAGGTQVDCWLGLGVQMPPEAIPSGAQGVAS